MPPKGRRGSSQSTAQQKEHIVAALRNRIANPAPPEEPLEFQEHTGRMLLESLNWNIDLAERRWRRFAHRRRQEEEARRREAEEAQQDHSEAEEDEDDSQEQDDESSEVARQSAPTGLASTGNMQGSGTTRQGPDDEVFANARLNVLARGEQERRDNALAFRRYVQHFH